MIHRQRELIYQGQPHQLHLETTKSPEDKKKI